MCQGEGCQRFFIIGVFDERKDEERLSAIMKQIVVKESRIESKSLPLNQERPASQLSLDSIHLALHNEMD